MLVKMSAEAVATEETALLERQPWTAMVLTLFTSARSSSPRLQPQLFASWETTNPRMGHQ